MMEKIIFHLIITTTTTNDRTNYHYAGVNMLRPSTYMDVLSIIGREDLGYNSTPPDGTCGYTAPLQAMLMMEPGLPVDAVLPAAKASLPFVLRDVGIEVCENPALRDSWRSPENRKYFFTELNKMVDEANKLEDKTDDGQVTKVTDDQVKDLIKRTGVAHGPWIFTHLLNALAIVLKRDIVVVAATSVTLYPRVAGRFSLSAEPGAKSETTAIGISGGSIAGNDGWIPIVAFMPSTLVIVFDNQGHFWCTRRSVNHNADNLMAAFGVERVKDVFIV